MGKIYQPSKEWDKEEKQPGVRARVVKVDGVINLKTGKEASPEEKAYIFGKITQHLEKSLSSPEALEQLEKVGEALNRMHPYVKKVEPFVQSSGLRAYLNEKRNIKDSEGEVYTDVHLIIVQYYATSSRLRRWRLRSSIKRQYDYDPPLVGLIEKTLSAIDKYRKDAKIF